MDYIVLCNTGSDSLSRVNTQSLDVQNFILSKEPFSIGPHELKICGENIISANNYNNTISIIKKRKLEDNYIEKYSERKNRILLECENVYIGTCPNDVVQYSNEIFVTCGEANSVAVYNMKEKRVDFVIPVGCFPHNIEICKNMKLAFTSNMGDDTISVIDIEKKQEIKKITVENTPIKINLSNNNHYLYVCLSYLGYDKEGYVGIISLKTLELIDKIKVGISPVDLYEESGYLYVSNFCGKSISIINLDNLKEEKQIEVSGMPRGIRKSKEKLFVGDYLNGMVNVINFNTKEIKAITVEKEPNAMTLIKTL